MIGESSDGMRPMPPANPPEPAARPEWKVDVVEPDFKMGKRQCTAKSKQTGKRCMAPPMPEGTKCRFHGGAPRSGRPSTKGRFSKAMGKLAAAYHDSLNDSTLTDTREPLAALDALTRRAAERAAERDTPEFRKRVQQLVETMATALRGQDVATFTAKLTELQKLAADGAEEDDALREAAEAFERFSERLEAHWKIKLDRKQAINARDLMVVVQRLVDIVRTEVSGDAAARVARGFDQVMLSTFRFMSEDPRRMFDPARH